MKHPAQIIENIAMAGMTISRKWKVGELVSVFMRQSKENADFIKSLSSKDLNDIRTPIYMKNQ